MSLHQTELGVPKAPRAVRQRNVVMSPVGLGIKTTVLARASSNVAVSLCTDSLSTFLILKTMKVDLLDHLAVCDSVAVSVTFSNNF
jgi:hypothetical protein